MNDNQQVTDAGRVNFKDRKKLSYLNLSLLPLTEEGSANFADGTELMEFTGGGNTTTTNDALKVFKNGTKLKTFALFNAALLTDAGRAFRGPQELGSPQPVRHEGYRSGRSPTIWRRARSRAASGRTRRVRRPATRWSGAGSPSSLISSTASNWEAKLWVIESITGR